MPPVTRGSKTDDHPQGLQGLRSSKYVATHVLATSASTNLLFETTFLHVVNELATNRFGAGTKAVLGITISASCEHNVESSRERPSATTPPSPSLVSCLYTYLGGSSSSTVGVFQALPSVFSRCSSSVASGATTSSSVAFSPDVRSHVRQRSRVLVVNVVLGFQHEYFQTPDRVCSLDLGFARVFSSHLDIGCFRAVSRQRLASPQFWWLRCAEHLTRCCSRTALQRIARQLVNELSSRLIVLNLRTTCSSPHKCSSVFSVLPSQTSSSQLHFKLATQQSCSGYPIPKNLDEGMVRLQPTTNSPFSCVLHCAQPSLPGSDLLFPWLPSSCGFPPPEFSFGVSPALQGE